MILKHASNIEEALEVSRLARECFGLGSGLIIPRKPKWAIYAEDDDGRMAGGVMLKRLGKYVGVISFIFVHERARGQKIGPMLLDRGVEALEQDGITTQIAVVRDDNTPSWNRFARKGFSVSYLLRALFGYSPATFGYLLLAVFANSGYSVWARDSRPQSRGGMKPSRSERTRAGGGVTISLVFAAIVGVSVGRFGAYGSVWLLWAIGLVVGVTVIRLLANYPFARAYGPVRLTLSHGGTIMTVLQSAVGGLTSVFGLPRSRCGMSRNSDGTKGSHRCSDGWLRCARLLPPI